MVWAFFGGIFLDIFSGGPMGASSLAFMAAVTVTGLGYRTFSRYHLLVPIGVSVVGTVIYGVTYLGVLTVLDSFAGLPAWTLPSARSLLAHSAVRHRAGGALQHDADDSGHSVLESHAGNPGDDHDVPVRMFGSVLMLG